MKILMTSIAFVTLVALPVLAADGQDVTIIKGSKSYQVRAVPDQTTSDPKSQSAPEKIEPAAGAQTDEPVITEKDTTRALQEQIRLPRKN